VLPGEGPRGHDLYARVQNIPEFQNQTLDIISFR
jgi:hypothetical protein